MKQMTKMINKGLKSIENLRVITLDVISAVVSGGKTINAITQSNSERRDLLNVLPYGISSAPTNGLLAQIVVNDSGGRSSVIGVYDNGRPTVNAGEIVIYTAFNSRIEMKSDGKIILKTATKTVDVDDIVTN